VCSDRARSDHPLRCVECGKLSTGRAGGWQARIAYAEEDGKPSEVAFYCPFCAVIEFGGLPGAEDGL
jgi:hypothetical protein